ncbi:unnamed protein product [Thelazia callipaeda]|uniref:Ornithine decarboxylase antizyme n=1 Tax=Thelazia callipaeda TaxID=103827 RepID=A0A0N5CXS0_THECL|nr:unnamed protein product [Thelazia callipaeda]
MPKTDPNARISDDVLSKNLENDHNQEECKSLKAANSNAEDEDHPDRHLAQIPIERDVKNRVKLYVLCDQRVWDDKGTGHVACVLSPEHQGATFIVVRLEHSGKFSEIILSKFLFAFYNSDVYGLENQFSFVVLQEYIGIKNSHGYNIPETASRDFSRVDR